MTLLAHRAYDEMAPYYDAFTDHPGYADWIRRLADVAARHTAGEPDRLLDVACGTGKSFLPLVDRFTAITACDVSAGMLAAAQEKAGPAVTLVRADMRELPPLGRFDLVSCLNDSLNYLLSEPDLARTLAALAGNVADGGVVMFDVNSRLAHREFFGSSHERRGDGAVLRWHGRGRDRRADGWFAEATFEVVREPVASEPVLRVRHVQRHHPGAAVRRCIGRAGLAVAAVHGVCADGELHDHFDEEHHIKALYVTRPRRSDVRKGGE